MTTFGIFCGNKRPACYGKKKNQLILVTYAVNNSTRFVRKMENDFRKKNLKEFILNTVYGAKK